jgi:C_GCAxxG_C_C family probable redox protein
MIFLMTHADRASELHDQGFNCAQAVFASFNDETGIDYETALKLSAPFGGGMGRLREVCGALTGAFLVMGAVCGNTDPKDPAKKAAHYDLIHDMGEEFREKYNTFICRDLLWPEGAPDPLPVTLMPEKRPCAELIRYAAEMVEKRLHEIKK